MFRSGKRGVGLKETFILLKVNEYKFIIGAYFIFEFERLLFLLRAFI